MKKLVLGLVALLVMAGCGHSSSGIGQAAGGQLGPQVEQIKAAAMTGDRTAAAAKLASLRAAVTDLRQHNQLSEAGAAKILAAAAEVEAQMGLPLPATVSAPQTATTAAPAPSVTSATRPPQVPGNGGNDKGKGDGKGKD